MILVCPALPFELVNLGFGIGNKDFCHVIGKFTGVKSDKGLGEIEHAQRLRQSNPELVLRRACHHADIAARRAHVRRFGIRRALCQEHFTQVIDVGIFLRINSKVAGVVDWRAIDRETHLIAVGAADAQAAAKEAGAVIAERVHPWQHFDGLVRIARRAERFQMRAGHRAARLGRVLLNQQTGAGPLSFNRDSADVCWRLLGPQGRGAAQGADQQRNGGGFERLHWIKAFYVKLKGRAGRNGKMVSGTWRREFDFGAEFVLFLADPGFTRKGRVNTAAHRGYGRIVKQI